VNLDISREYLQHVVTQLESFRSHPLGFRVAGTPEERQATAFIAGELRNAGLTDVVEEPVPVDAWRLHDAFVELGEGRRYECASFGGVPETGPRGVQAPLVQVRRGGRKQLDALDVGGKIALVDWEVERLWPYHVGLELGLRGAAALIVTSPPGAPYYQAPDALGTFDGLWHAEAPPCVTIRKEDAGELKAHEGADVRVVLSAPLTRGAEAANVVGILPGRRDGAPSIVAGHHDGWFSAAFDDASAVAVTLALARAFAAQGVRLERPIAFVSHTAEEYGIAAGWTRRICRQAARDGLLPHGYRLAAPSTWTEVWPFLAAGIPGINVSTFSSEFDRSEYHTQFDTSDRVDFDYLERLTRVCATLLSEADLAVLDYGARSRDVRRSLGREIEHARLESALDDLARAEGRKRFTAVGRGLHGLDARETARYPHEQTAADVRFLETALAELGTGRQHKAANALARVGLNWLCADLGPEAFRIERARRGRTAPRACWAAQGDPDIGPDLWNEIASLRRETDARPYGPWLERSLHSHLAASSRELARRLDRMAAAAEGKIFPLPRPHAKDLPR